MDDGKNSNEEESRLLELFQHAALNNFPNPERIDCPGPEFLKKLAYDRKSIPLNDPSLTHVARCSPCFREFAEFRDRATNRTKSRRLILIAAGGTVAAGLGIWRLPMFRQNGTPSETYVAASLDLKDRSVVRGNSDTSQSPTVDSLILPRRRVSLTITLPFASPPGDYEVRILREVGKPLLTAGGQAHLERGATFLNVHLDLAGLSGGQYLLGIHRVPFDWTYHPVVIE
jgi:hypothetical protein